MSQVGPFCFLFWETELPFNGKVGVSHSKISLISSYMQGMTVHWLRFNVNNSNAHVQINNFLEYFCVEDLPDAL